MSATDTAHIACNLCDHRQVSILSTRSRSGAPLRSVCCQRCGLSWADPRPHDARTFYEDEYRVAYKQTVEPKAKHVLRAGRVALDRARKIASLLKRPLEVLDVGSGGGEFSYLLKTLGHSVTGVEPNRGYGNYAAQEYGLSIQHGFIGDVSLDAGAYDLITIWHVLEHTESPKDVLAQLRRALRPEGRLVVEVPNLEATCQSPRSSFHEAHLFTFSPATLEAMGQRAGLGLESLAISGDGGNLTAVFRLAEARPVHALAGNHDRVAAIVRAHTPLRHLFTRHPYARLAGRFVRAIDERLTLRAGVSGRALLDALYGPHRNGLAPAPLVTQPALRLLPTAAAAIALGVGLDQLLFHNEQVTAALSLPGAWALYLGLQAAVLAPLVGRIRRAGGSRREYAKVLGLMLPLLALPEC